MGDAYVPPLGPNWPLFALMLQKKVLPAAENPRADRVQQKAQDAAEVRKQEVDRAYAKKR